MTIIAKGRHPLTPTTMRYAIIVLMHVATFLTLATIRNVLETAPTTPACGTLRIVPTDPHRKHIDFSRPAVVSHNVRDGEDAL